MKNSRKYIFLCIVFAFTLCFCPEVSAENTGASTVWYDSGEVDISEFIQKTTNMHSNSIGFASVYNEKDGTYSDGSYSAITDLKISVPAEFSEGTETTESITVYDNPFSELVSYEPESDGWSFDNSAYTNVQFVEGLGLLIDDYHGTWEYLRYPEKMITRNLSGDYELSGSFTHPKDLNTSYFIIRFAKDGNEYRDLAIPFNYKGEAQSVQIWEGTTTNGTTKDNRFNLTEDKVTLAGGDSTVDFCLTVKENATKLRLTLSQGNTCYVNDNFFVTEDEFFEDETDSSLANCYLCIDDSYESTVKINLLQSFERLPEYKEKKGIRLLIGKHLLSAPVYLLDGDSTIYENTPAKLYETDCVDVGRYTFGIQAYDVEDKICVELTNYFNAVYDDSTRILSVEGEFFDSESDDVVIAVVNRDNYTQIKHFDMVKALNGAFSYSFKFTEDVDDCCVIISCNEERYIVERIKRYTSDILPVSEIACETTGNSISASVTGNDAYYSFYDESYMFIAFYNKQGEMIGVKKSKNYEGIRNLTVPHETEKIKVFLFDGILVPQAEYKELIIERN